MIWGQNNINHSQFSSHDSLSYSHNQSNAALLNATMMGSSFLPQYRNDSIYGTTSNVNTIQFNSISYYYY